MTLHHSPGYTPGSIAIGLSLEKIGSVVLIGDAFHVKENYEQEIQPGTLKRNFNDWHRSGTYLRSLVQRKQAKVGLGHEPSYLNTFVGLRWINSKASKFTLAANGSRDHLAGSHMILSSVRFSSPSKLTTQFIGDIALTTRSGNSKRVWRLGHWRLLGDITRKQTTQTSTPNRIKQIRKNPRRK